MKNNILPWQITGFAVTSIGGTLLHFLYDWSGQNRFAAIFSGVNESTWEHMKLLFFPMFAFALIQSFFFKENSAFFCIKLRGILLGLLLIPVLFCTYNGVIGKSPDWVNIAIFFIAAAAAFIFEVRLMKRNETECSAPGAAVIMLCLVALLFVIFTFEAPHIAIFRDPLTGSYGIEG